MILIFELGCLNVSPKHIFIGQKEGQVAISGGQKYQQWLLSNLPDFISSNAPQI